MRVWGVLAASPNAVGHRCCCPHLLASRCPAESGARDTFNYRVLPAFTTEEAAELLAHYLYFNLNPTASADQHPPADEVARIRRKYASTFAFLIAALGTRARVLALSIDSLHGKHLVPDVELATKGVPIPGAQAVVARALARARALVRITVSRIPRLASCCRRAAAAPSRDPVRHCDCCAGHLRTSRLGGGRPFPACRWCVWRVKMLPRTCHCVLHHHDRPNHSPLRLLRVSFFQPTRSARSTRGLSSNKTSSRRC